MDPINGRAASQLQGGNFLLHFSLIFFLSPVLLLLFLLQILFLTLFHPPSINLFIRCLLQKFSVFKSSTISSSLSSSNSTLFLRYLWIFKVLFLRFTVHLCVLLTFSLSFVCFFSLLPSQKFFLSSSSSTSYSSSSSNSTSS